MSNKEKSGNWFARHKVLTGILIIILLVAVVGALGGGGKDQTRNSSSSANKAPGAAEIAPKIGSEVKDGKFSFIVKSIECGKSEVIHPESDMVRKTAQGEYCLVTLSVKNIGDAQQYFSEGDQKLLNVEGQQFSPDTTATLYNSGNADVFLAQINPGNTVEGTLVFDVPKGMKPVTAQLHDSAFSGGVKVELK